MKTLDILRKAKFDNTKAISANAIYTIGHITVSILVGTISIPTVFTAVLIGGVVSIIAGYYTGIIDVINYDRTRNYIFRPIPVVTHFDL